MAKPIPVFSFIFAAYAATSGGKMRKSGGCVATKLAPGAPFRTAWRTRAALGGAMFAKIKVVKGSGPRDLRLAVKSSSERGEEIWVSGIVESGLGFLGSPVDAFGRHENLAASPPLRFHVINVLDWRLGDGPDSSARPSSFCKFGGNPDGAAPLSDTAIP